MHLSKRHGLNSPRAHLKAHEPAPRSTRDSGFNWQKGEIRTGVRRDREE